jgi:hypothetical protein
MDVASRRKSNRVKRTYNLPQSSVDTVRRLAEEYGVADSQDAVVERAIRDLERRVRDAHDEILWKRSTEDPEFLAEMQELETGFASDDDRAWQS